MEVDQGQVWIFRSAAATADGGRRHRQPAIARIILDQIFQCRASWASSSTIRIFSIASLPHQSGNNSRFVRGACWLITGRAIPISGG